MSRFVRIDRDTAYLFQPSVQDWLPEGHLARFIVDAVEQQDLSELKGAFAGRGEAAFPPAMMVALLFYGYATGKSSSRRIVRTTYDSVAFRFIAANTHPDHDTIAAFRKRFLPQLKGLFVQILQLASALELVKLGKPSLAGTKARSYASRHRALSHGHAKRIKARLQTEVEQLPHMAEHADRSNCPDGLDIPAEIERREARLAALREAKPQIEASAQERLEAEKKVHEDKVATREAREKKTGKRFGGELPKPPAVRGDDKEQVNLTDEQPCRAPAPRARDELGGVKKTPENHRQRTPRDRRSDSPPVV